MFFPFSSPEDNVEMLTCLQRQIMDMKCAIFGPHWLMQFGSLDL